jgi:carbon monoxide dehydrogenase subunit G
MRLENEFDVAAPAEAAWDLLLDVPRVVPCMPGAELVETVDETTWKARMRVKLGPIQLSFLASIHQEDRDDAAHSVRLAADAREERGRGAARATIDSSLAAADGGTHVMVVTELSLTGAVAQYARGMVQGVAAQLLESFAQCLERELTPAPAAGPATNGGAPAETQAPAQQPQQPVKPVSGLSMGFRALWRAFTGLFKRR